MREGGDAEGRREDQVKGLEQARPAAAEGQLGVEEVHVGMGVRRCRPRRAPADRRVQEPLVDRMLVGEVGKPVVGPEDGCAQCFQPPRQVVDGASDLAVGRGQRVVSEHQDLVVRQCLPPGRHQGEGHTRGVFRLRTRQDAERSPQVCSTTGHWPDDRQGNRDPVGPRGGVAPGRDQSPGGLVPEDAAEGCGDADRATDVGAEFEGGHSRREGRRGAA